MLRPRIPKGMSTSPPESTRPDGANGRQDARKRLLNALATRLLGAIVLMMVIAVAAVLTAVSYPNLLGPAIILVATSGAVGSALVIYRDAAKMPNDELQRLGDSRTQFVLNLFVGSVLAVLLYMLFLGSLVAGELFPEFAADATVTGSENNGTPPVSEPGIHKITTVHAKGYTDYAKLITWSVIAGFSKNYVLGLLGSLPQRSKAE
ncbi:MAG: hypothetical protein NXI31_04315 [bacterium]|nr:hypothetical protein [bacterium]